MQHLFLSAVENHVVQGFPLGKPSFSNKRVALDRLQLFQILPPLLLLRRRQPRPVLSIIHLPKRHQLRPVHLELLDQALNLTGIIISDRIEQLTLGYIGQPRIIAVLHEPVDDLKVLSPVFIRVSI